MMCTKRGYTNTRIWYMYIYCMYVCVKQSLNEDELTYIYQLNVIHFLPTDAP